MILHHRLRPYLASIGALAWALSMSPVALDQHDLHLTTKLAFAGGAGGGHGGGDGGHGGGAGTGSGTGAGAGTGLGTGVDAGGGGVGDAAAGQSNGHGSPGIAAASQAGDQGTSSAAIVQGLVGDKDDQNTVDPRIAGAMADELARDKTVRQDAARAYADEVARKKAMRQDAVRAYADEVARKKAMRQDATRAYADEVAREKAVRQDAVRAYADQVARDKAVQEHATRAKSRSPATREVARSHVPSRQGTAVGSSGPVIVSGLGADKAPAVDIAKTPVPSPDIGTDRAAGSESFNPGSQGSDSARGPDDAPFRSASLIVAELGDLAGSAANALDQLTRRTFAAGDDEFGASKSIAESYVPDWIRRMSPSRALVWLGGAGLIIALLVGALKSRRTSHRTSRRTPDLDLILAGLERNLPSEAGHTKRKGYDTVV